MPGSCILFAHKQTGGNTRLMIMKQLLTLLFLALAMQASGQAMSSRDWEEQAKTNIRLLPRYGGVQKTEEQKAIDRKFIDETMKGLQYMGDRREASNDLITTGFSYIGKNDLKTAMYRFNQAYLLDSTNSDIYWGYGAVYMGLGALEKARQLYSAGLAADPKNTHLLTDYGTYYMAQYYGVQSVDERSAQANLDSALNYLNRSYAINPKDENTAFKLSVSYWLKGDCDAAWRYYKACKTLGGLPITDEYTSDLSARCGAAR